MAIARLGFDSLSALILAATAAIGAYLPVFLAAAHRRRGGVGRSLTFVLLNMFSAGVMVSAGFCHLLGEALKLMPQKQQFPMAPFLCGLGFLLTLVADRFAHQASGAGAGCHAAGDARGELGAVAAAGVPGEVGPVAALAGIDLEKGRYVSKTSLDEESARLIHSTSSGDSGGLGGSGGSKLPPYVHGGGSMATAAAAGNGVLEASGDPGGPRLMALGLANGSGSVQHRHSPGPGVPGGILELEQEGPLGAEGLGGGGVATGAPRLAGGGEAGGGGGGARARMALVQRGSRVSFITAMLMGVALCFHSLLEGAAMGAQETVSNSLHIFIAIVSHKGLAAYALGSSLVDSDATTQRFWSVVLPFTLASPAGIFLGYIISDLAKGTGAASLSALASGTFLYVAFMEVIPRELHEGGRTGLKLALLLLGFGAMSLLAIWA